MGNRLIDTLGYKPPVNKDVNKPEKAVDVHSEKCEHEPVTGLEWGAWLDRFYAKPDRNAYWREYRRRVRGKA
jgi:hypothetical protein